jgi:hypothetical protein
LKKLRAFSVAVAVVLIATLPAAYALDDDEFSGLAANTLTITVGYFGGEYHEKVVFTLDDLWALNVVNEDYTFIDNMPSVVIDHVAGVTLADLMDAAGIDIGSVENFNFWTNDKAGGYYTSLSKAFLIDTPRYCYYSLPDNFDYDNGAGNEYATSDAVRVQTVIALADDWQRSLAGASFGSDYMNLNTNTRFRLVYGQTNAWEHTASNSAKWVHKIEVTLGGAPPTTIDNEQLTIDNTEIGSTLQTTEDAGLEVGDNAQAEDSASAIVTEPSEPADTPTEVVDVAVTEPEPVTQVRYKEMTILPPPTAAETDDIGGVQDWRKDKMSEDATALTDIQRDMPIAATVFAVIALFVGGGIVKFILYMREVKNAV